MPSVSFKKIDNGWIVEDDFFGEERFLSDERKVIEEAQDIVERIVNFLMDGEPQERASIPPSDKSEGILEANL